MKKIKKDEKVLIIKAIIIAASAIIASFFLTRPGVEVDTRTVVSITIVYPIMAMGLLYSWSKKKKDKDNK